MNAKQFDRASLHDENIGCRMWPWRAHVQSVFSLFFLLLSLLNSRAEAIVVIRGEGRNLTPPVGAGANQCNCGWIYEGYWHGYTGTAIGPHHFITADHIGGHIGRKFIYQGKSYHAVCSFHLPGTDLRVWRVAERFRDWALLYEAHEEVGHDVVMFGHGTVRGEAVTANSRLCGWRHAHADEHLSWGRGWIQRVIPSDFYEDDDPKSCQWMTVPFDGSVGPDAGCASEGDSGGGVFLCDNGAWKLAGIIHGYSKRFQITPQSGPESAAIFNSRGLFMRLPSKEVRPVPSLAQTAPSTDTTISGISSNAVAIRQAMHATDQIYYGILYIVMPSLIAASILFLGFRIRCGLRAKASYTPGQARRLSRTSSVKPPAKKGQTP